LLYIYNRHNGIGGDVEIGYQSFHVDAFRHQPRRHRTQVHLQLKMKLSGSKGCRGPMANIMCRYLPDSRWEAESLLVKV
jgi:hypothetical protein